MSTSDKNKDEKRILLQRRERILAQIEAIDAELAQCSDGELDWCGYCHHLTYLLDDDDGDDDDEDDDDDGKSLTNVLPVAQAEHTGVLIEDVISDCDHSVLGMSVTWIDCHALLYSLATHTPEVGDHNIPSSCA